jgi:hypothetical protein
MFMWQENGKSVLGEVLAMKICLSGRILISWTKSPSLMKRTEFPGAR